MNTLTIILAILVSLLYLKWVLIILVFPFQVVHGQMLKRSAPQPPKGGVSTPPLGGWGAALDKLYIYWEKIFKKGYGQQ